MKKLFTSIVFSLLMLPLLVAQNTVTIDASANWIGFMTVFNLDGSVNFGDFWAVPDLKTVLSTADNTVTLQPNYNTYDANDPFWTDPNTGEGAKDMEASTFIEPGDSFNGSDLTFTGNVQSYTLDPGYTAQYFIKALDPNNGFADALGGSLVFDLPSSGNFSVTAAGADLAPGLVIQYGFTIKGRNANPDDEATLGSVVVTGPSSAANTVTVDAGASWIGFMNVFNLDGTFNFGDFWAVPDLKTVLNTMDNTVTLQPNFNTYADNPTDPFWVDQTTGEGAKEMEASTFIEPGAGFNGSDLTFTGNVQSYTLDPGYSAQYFIKALDPNNGFADALGGSLVFDLPNSGNFSVTASGADLAPGLIIQYGFAVRGRNANPDDEATLGSVVLGSTVTSVNNPTNPTIEAVVSPNPARDLVNVELLNPTGQTYQVSILGLNGQQLHREKGADAIFQLDTSVLNAGMYFIRIDQQDKQIVKKLMIVR